MVLLAAVADSAERAIENNVMVLDNSPNSTVKGKIGGKHLINIALNYVMPIHCLEMVLNKKSPMEHDFV